MIGGGDFMQRAGKSAVEAGIHIIQTERDWFSRAGGKGGGFGDLPPQPFQPRLARRREFSHLFYSRSYENGRSRRESMALILKELLVFVADMFTKCG